MTLSYIGACWLLAGCPGKPAPLVPMPLAPADPAAAAAWARATLPGRDTAIRFRWKYQDADRRWGGRGQARIAPPDSLRFDYVGPLGLGAGAAVVVADSVLWAGLGVARPPADAQVFGLSDAAGDSRRQIWRFVDGSDTLDYVVLEGAGRVLQAEWRQAGKMLARSTTQFDGRGLPAGARLDFPEGPARFELSVVAVDTAAVIDPALWRRRR